MGRFVVMIGAVSVVLGAGCAARDAPYRFHGDLVAGVSAEPPPTLRRVAIKPMARGGEPPRARSELGYIDTERPPVRKRVVRPSDETPAPLAEILRGHVGKRDKKASDLQFAVRAIRSLGLEADRALRTARSGQALVKLARSREAISPPGPALLGDLVVFNNVVGRTKASLIGVVVASRADGTIEFVYLARGVVRRGYVNPTQPTVKRDKSGTVLNTFVRHSNGGDPRGTRYLAGRLIAHIVHLDRLSR